MGFRDTHFSFVLTSFCLVGYNRRFLIADINCTHPFVHGVPGPDGLSVSDGCLSTQSDPQDYLLINHIGSSLAIPCSRVNLRLVFDDGCIPIESFEWFTSTRCSFGPHHRSAYATQGFYQIKEAL